MAIGEFLPRRENRGRYSSRERKYFLECTEYSGHGTAKEAAVPVLGVNSGFL